MYASSWFLEASRSQQNSLSCVYITLCSAIARPFPLYVNPCVISSSGGHFLGLELWLPSLNTEVIFWGWGGHLSRGTPFSPAQPSLERAHLLRKLLRQTFSYGLGSVLLTFTAMSDLSQYSSKVLPQWLLYLYIVYFAFIFVPFKLCSPKTGP